MKKLGEILIFIFVGIPVLIFLGVFYGQIVWFLLKALWKPLVFVLFILAVMIIYALIGKLFGLGGNHMSDDYGGGPDDMGGGA